MATTAFNAEIILSAFPNKQKLDNEFSVKNWKIQNV